MEVVVSVVPRYREPVRVRRWVATCFVAVVVAALVPPAQAAFANAPITVTISATGTGNGVVTSTPGAGRCVIANGTAVQTGCVISIEQGASLTLTVDPQFGSTFGGWGGACTGLQLDCTIQPSQATSVSARFIPPRRARDVAGALMAEEIVLSSDEWLQLDRFGNGNGVFDLGDLLALLDRTGEKLTPATAAALTTRVGPQDRRSPTRRTP